MTQAAVRATLYLPPDLLAALRQRAAAANTSLSRAACEALREQLADDLSGLAALADHTEEGRVSFDELLAMLEADATA